MKKSLLFAVAALCAVSASAETQLLPHQQKAQLANKLDKQLFSIDKLQKHEAAKPQIRKAMTEASGPIMGEFPGTPTVYSMAGYPEGYFDYDLPASIEIEEDVVYLDGLIPGAFAETVIVKGTRNGNIISIPTQQIYVKYNLWDYYIVDMYVAQMDLEDGLASDVPFELVINEDGSISSIDETILGLYADVTDYGFSDRELISYNMVFTLTPFEHNEVTVLPEDAVTEDYICKYEYNDLPVSSLSQLYVDGETLYTTALTAGYGVFVQGTLADGKLTVPSYQFLGTNNAYLLNMIGITNLEVNEFGMVESYDLLPELTFTVTDDCYVLDEGQIVGIEYGTPGELAYYMSNVEISKYMGDVIAKPLAPVFEEFAGYMAEYDQYAMRIFIPTTGTNGEFLRLENMEWAIYADEFVYTFSPDDGYFLDEDMEWFPAAMFVDNESYDIICDNGEITLYIYDSLFSEIGVQSRNTVDGVTMYSNIQYVGIDPDSDGRYSFREVEVENDIPVGISGVQASKVNNLFDLQGRLMNSNAKGLMISNGKVCFVK